MDNLKMGRDAIRPLLYERHSGDAISDYFAFYHKRTQLFTFPEEADAATGYIALAQTGLDLFRPLVTLRLPKNMDEAVGMIYSVLPPQTAVILNILHDTHPLISALFDIQADDFLQVMILDKERFQPEINVMVTQTPSNNEHPRFVVRSNNEVGASATINWQTDYFAEIGVTTLPQYRRRGWGRSVVAKMAMYVLENGRQPLYVASTNNEASIHLATSLGFVDTGVRHHLIQAVLRPRP